MKLVKSSVCGTLLVLCVACFVLTTANNVAKSQEQESTVLPFSDDSILIFDSPRFTAEFFKNAIEKNELSYDLQSLNRSLDEADKKIQKFLDENKEAQKRLDYLISFCKADSGTISVARSILKTYVKYVDGVFLTAEIPSNIESFKDEFPNWLALTLIFNDSPDVLDPRKYFDSDCIEIIRENDSDLVGKITIKDKEEVKARLFFGGSKIADLGKYVVVTSLNLENVEKKLVDFQNNGDAINKEILGDVLSRRVFKRPIFENIVKAIANSNSKDDRIKTLGNILDEVNSFSLETKGSEKGVVQVISIEADDEESSQNINDLISGGLAALKIADKNKSDKKIGEELGAELLNKTSVLRDNRIVTVSTEIGFDWIQKLLEAMNQVGNDK